MTDLFEDAALLCGVLAIDQLDTMEEDLCQPALNATLTLLGADRIAAGCEVVAAAALSAIANSSGWHPLWRQTVMLHADVTPLVREAADLLEWSIHTYPESAGQAAGALRAVNSEPGQEGDDTWAWFVLATGAMSLLVTLTAGHTGETAGDGDSDAVRPIAISVERAVRTIEQWSATS